MFQSTRSRCAHILAFGMGCTLPGAPVLADTPPTNPYYMVLKNHPGLPAAAPADVASIDALVTAFADSISVPAGGTIDVKRLDTLFVPGGRIAIGSAPKADRAADVTFVSPDQYAANFDRVMKASGGHDGGFFDKVIANRTERFGVMAHVYSSYESREELTDPKPFRRGVKSFELLQSHGRWYIVQVFYDFERPGNPIPPDDLKPSSP